MSNTALSPKPTTSTQAARNPLTAVFSGRQGLKRREALLAYLFLFPAMLIIGLFGLFPLIFSAYQSTRAGLNNIVGRPDGFGQYIRAIDNLAYVLAFWLGLYFLFMGIRKFMEVRDNLKEQSNGYTFFALPGILTAVGLGLLLQFIFLYLPGLLEIGEKMRGFTAEERNELFPTFVREAWLVEGVSSTFYTAVAAIIIGFVFYQFIIRQTPKLSQLSNDFFGGFTTGTLYTILGIALIWITYTQIQVAYAEALEEGESLSIWSQLVTISAGFVLLVISGFLWRSANSFQSNRMMIAKLMAALLLMVGGWILIAELPAMIAEGNEDWWVGLRTTIWFVIGSLPIQLSLGLFLATLMYQNIRGKSLFRMIYFLPFVTPAVGSAGVFRVLFSGNQASPINSAMGLLNLEPLKWLNEPNGIFELMLARFDVALPEWAAGPSLALVVAIIYGIWRYTGYNIVFFLAGLGNISSELYEAASIDGASRWDQFRHITLPLISPITYFLTIFGVIGTFKAFNTIFVLRTGQALGSMDTASLVIFDAFNRDTRYGYAAALGMILLFVILGATALLNRYAEDRVFYG
ncbi:MAG: sugar ABC transporter permease [Chloroflexota bacterium]